MLPCLAAAAKYPNLKFFASDLKKVMPLVEKCHQLNDSPSNIIPIELAWGNPSHHERLSGMLESKPVCALI